MNAPTLMTDNAGTWSLSEGLFEPRAVLAGTSALVMITGAAMGQPVFLGGGAAGLCMVCRNYEQLVAAAQGDRISRLASRLLRDCGPYSVDGGAVSSYLKPSCSLPRATPPAPPSPEPPEEGPPQSNQAAESTTELVDQMFQSGRYALLLKPEAARHLHREHYLQAIRELDEKMSLVPDGGVLVGMEAERATLGQAASGLAPSPNGIMQVDACYLDRWTVTNAEFQRFVDAGGYEQLEFWPEEALPALFDFVDLTGATAPRYWIDGRYPPRAGRLPVVGVCWYEAVAYARWIGKRLPGDAEWTKACAWPIESAPGRIAQRRYPWGESFDARRANLWCACLGEPAPVDAFPEGATVGGVQQMIGNVWEWTADSLEEATPDFVHFPSALRSIRGGAYNTYFENQATCHFQSGEHPLARRANIGIRLALDMAGLASPASVEASHSPG